MAWKPILDPATARQALEAVDAVADALLESVGRLDEPSLSVGLSGTALFFAYLDRARPSPRWRDAGLECLERAMELVATGRWPSTLFDGFCGLGWTIEHLGVADDDDDPLHDVDAALSDYLDAAGADPPVELAQGLAGLGTYWLERLPRRRAHRGLQRILTRLEETAQRHGDLRTWPVALRSGTTKRSDRRCTYDPGVAHGVAGVAGFLSRLGDAGIETERAARLARGAVGWLMAQQLPESESCRFPVAVDPGISPVPARTAWCSGDLGIAAVLLPTARSLGRRDWEKTALEWAHRAARRPLPEMGVVDATLCHGTAGLGLLFRRLHHATGDPVTGEAARAWFERTLALRQPGTGLAGFSTWSGDGQGADHWRGEPGLQTGIAGIGLALLAAATEIEPSWDRVLGLSGRRSPGSTPRQPPDSSSKENHGRTSV